MPEYPGQSNSWQFQVLEAIGAAPSELTMNAMSWWAESEGMPASENNWLATTIGGYGGYPVNSAGVMAYPSQGAGVAATAATLRLPAYSGVVAAFRDGNSLSYIWSEINASPWCAHCQGGKYPVVLYDNLGANVSTAPLPTAPSTAPAPAPRGQAAASGAWDDVRLAMGRPASHQIGVADQLAARAKGARR